MEHFLTSKEVCEILKITPAQLRGIRERNEISFCRFGGHEKGAVRFTMKDVEEYAERVRVRAQRPQLLPLVEVATKSQGRGRPKKQYQSGTGYVPGMKVV